MRKIDWEAEIDFMLDQFPLTDRIKLDQVLAEYLSVPIEKRTEEHKQKAVKAIKEIILSNWHHAIWRKTVMAKKNLCIYWLGMPNTDSFKQCLKPVAKGRKRHFCEEHQLKVDSSLENEEDFDPEIHLT